MKKIVSITLASLLVAGGAWATGEGHGGGPKSDTQASGGNAMQMTEGEVRKIDPDNKKVTLKHGEIKNLGMPGMTMVFQVQDPAALNSLKVGDKVRFMAERQSGAIVVTHIEAAK